MEKILKIFLILGTLLFGYIFLFSFLSPHTIEKNATSFIKMEIEKEVNLKLDNFNYKYKNNKLIKLSKKIFKKNKEKINNIKNNLKHNLHEKIASVIATMQNFNCKCRKKYAKMIHDKFIIKLSFLKKSNEKLKDFMKTKYMNIVQDLIYDFKIFAGSNFIIFLTLLILLYKKSKANLQITFVAGLLFISTIICIYFYIFEQDWFYTIIYHDYVGYFYLAYIGVLFLFLCDIVFNKARVTTELVNIFLNVIGSGLQAISC